MPSTYSPDLRIELIANGEQSGTWGTTTNNNLGTLIEDAISGAAAVSVTSSSQALTALNGAADQARCAALVLTTTTGAPFNVFVPPVSKLYAVRNNSGYAATFYCSTVLGNTTAAGSGVSVPTGRSALLRSDGTNVADQLTYITDSFQIGGTLVVDGASTFTGAATFGSTVTLNANPTLNLQAATKQYVDSALASGIPAGVIAMWSGTIATIPSGWALCNGSNGTPDLRERFIIGASVDSGGQSVTTITGANTKTGGAKDAIVVSHSHSASSSVSDPGHVHTWNRIVPGNTAVGVDTAGNFSNSATNTSSAVTGISVSTSVSSAGSSGTDANLVPYFALAYIMKT
jgi:microcystin-dependent protein